MSQEKRKRILYVDDDDSLVLLITRLLEREGYSTTGFTDPEEALREFLARSGDFDVVVTDVTMPEMSGFDLAARVLAARPDVPVFVTSGCVRNEDEKMAQQTGIRAIITKPNTVNELQRHLEQLFGAVTSSPRED
jgi:two-component system cell cycle sensor histidine kinase/response regulator CckA